MHLKVTEKERFLHCWHLHKNLRNLGDERLLEMCHVRKSFWFAPLAGHRTMVLTWSLARGILQPRLTQYFLLVNDLSGRAVRRYSVISSRCRVASSRLKLSPSWEIRGRAKIGMDERKIKRWEPEKLRKATCSCNRTFPNRSPTAYASRWTPVKGREPRIVKGAKHVTNQ